MKKQQRASASIEADVDTIPSRLDELTTRSRLEESQRNRAGWRRNLLLVGLAVLVAVLIYLNR